MGYIIDSLKVLMQADVEEDNIELPDECKKAWKNAVDFEKSIYEPKKNKKASKTKKIVKEETFNNINMKVMGQEERELPEER